MNNIRDKFEQKFPFPIGVKFHSDGDYIWLGGNHHGDTCEPYDSMWKAWQAATEQSQKEIAELQAREKVLVELLGECVDTVRNEYNEMLELYKRAIKRHRASPSQCER